MPITTEVAEWAGFIRGLGFDVYIAKSGTYGFITDRKAERVLSFSFTDGGSLSGNYGPPSQKSGTGWRIDLHPTKLITHDDVHKQLYAEAPKYCGNGWKYYTTVAQHLATYDASSHYTKVGA